MSKDHADLTHHPSEGAAADSTRFPIVGVGSSAGGLLAVSSFLEKLPGSTGMAFVMVQHLDPTHESLLPTLLARSTRMPIIAARDGLSVAPNTIYTITHNTRLTIEHGTLRVTPRDESPGPHFTIDLFMHSLAKDCPGRAIGVVLSGTGTDGTLGLVAIKAAGGITFAQDDSAEHSGMPLNAIDHGCVDFILPPAGIAREIERISLHGFPEVPQPLPIAEISEEPDSPADVALPPEDNAHIAAIIETVRLRAAIDFSQYRPTTIKRRIIRRLGELGVSTLKDYALYIAGNPQESAALVQDLLINVTSFYRDKAAFSALTTTIFPTLMRNHQANDPIRIWIAGCSTGQEVYSIAIELLEHLRAISVTATIQIFCSDISEWALAKARAGFYSENAVADIPSDRLNLYFTKESLGYRIKRAVRDLCIFAKHDITADTPFSRIDLISCRNLLIYLAPVLQTKVFHTFHFAMKPGGLLLLGSSESVGRSSDLFETTDEKNRIFRKKTTGRRPHMPAVPVIREAIQNMPPPMHPFIPTVTDLQRAADRLVLGRYAPAGVLINASLDIIQFRGHTQPFLEPAQGEASLHLLSMVPFGVADVLKGAIAEAGTMKIPVRRERVPLRRGEHFREINIEIIPILLSAENPDCSLILFEESGKADPASPPPRPDSPPQAAALTADAREIQQLRGELASAHEYIQSITDQFRTIGEQLRTSQEESTSTSEEFRSTNEELQTAKEEVDATNEELSTVNEELRSTNQTLAKTMEMTTAIVESIRFPVLVLDADLNVETANRAFLSAFHETAALTLGRRIYQLGNGQWAIPELRRLLEDILPRNSAFDDFPVTSTFNEIGERTILVNARRLQGTDPKPRILLVFADITEQNRIANDLKEKSEALARSNAELDDFASVAAHDLQDPLRMISNFATLLEHRYKATLDDQGREYLKQVTESAKRMSSLIKAVLEYSRISNQKADFTLLDIAKPLHIAMVNLEAKVHDAQATITEGPLPQVKANPDHMTRLFQNLLSNAIKFRCDKRALKVHVSASESENEWTISIADNGIGIDLHKSGGELIFQLFRRLHSADKYPGTGIGLAACKKIVGHHGGRIWVESTPDVGSTFFFTMPK